VSLFAGQREKLHVSPSPDIIRAKFLRPSDVAARLLPSQNQMCAAVYRQRTSGESYGGSRRPRRK